MDASAGRGCHCSADGVVRVVHCPDVSVAMGGVCFDRAAPVGRTLMCCSLRRQQSSFYRPPQYYCRDLRRSQGIRPRAVVLSALYAKNRTSLAETLCCRCSPEDLKQSASEPNAPVLKNLAFVAAGIGLLYFLTLSQLGVAFRSSLMASWLGRSGFIAALSLIFLSEIGDKTFFICAILAMRLGRWISFCGTVLALGVMTVLSVGMGVAFNAIPDAMKTSFPVGKYLSVALLFFFGLTSIRNGIQKGDAEDGGDELADAEETVERAAQTGQVSTEGSEEHSRIEGWCLYLRSTFVVAALIFVAEWGDRSMLTTIALGASQSPLGVALGGIVGHTLAAIIAVVGGSFISNFISEKSINLTSGLLFIVFAITTALNWT